MDKKTSSDESSLENISIKDRPMNVAEEFTMMQSNEWLDAKAAVDEIIPESSERARLTLLCDVIQVSG